MADHVSTFAAARRICERSDWTVTNLELQKMLYLAQMVFMGKHRERLLNGTFEAWDYGPVLPTLYSQVKSFGSGPIKDVFFGVGEVKDADRAQMLDDAYDQLSKKTAGQLVSITHWKNGAWAKHYVPGSMGVKIPDPDILKEYQDRMNV
ncbi:MULTISPECIES: Panacea domain-containing protein [unclassified Brevundimonas]|jgi:uncharacterized phage-associated protein|uniref:Panacea domain-containing protein n=1 Tax=unclassified Brevundimonas TaxID=2622653 RepID=UPI000C5B0A48|nr:MULTISPECIES: type II toxin-antitoxin system antitoxin SocA domain-containing protein [unclassified Brevundimonas]MAL89139.1 hypothetical protein [Brevundimonas sp.]HAJ01863.1 hypothetical protein [Brevundimonas sp.]HAV50264.1 hypothetical protein [Brevundimonas sp.]|tara:strand:+ start:283 stop:729 length:447 start_codon:yes stop_codon:yes gene_type:complete